MVQPRRSSTTEEFPFVCEQVAETVRPDAMHHRTTLQHEKIRAIVVNAKKDPEDDRVPEVEKYPTPRGRELPP